MTAAKDRVPCYVALIDSRTLKAETLFTSASCLIESDDTFFSIYSLINHFAAVTRRRFILALNTRSSFACTVSSQCTEYTVELYCTNCFGVAWSHLLILRTCCNPAPLHYYPHSEARFSSIYIKDILSSIHSYNRLAANNLLTETPAVIKQYLDRANSLCDRLIDHFCSRLF